MSVLLEVEGLEAGYGPVRVLHGVRFAVAEGEISVILGANGAGKTTTLRTLCGMVAARGRIVFAGRDVVGMPTEETVRLGVAHVPQGRGTFSDLTVDENLRLGAYLRRDRRAVAEDLERWYKFFPQLTARRKQIAGTLSGGEQQMLAVARALMLRPRLLLLDEPSLGLAPIITQELFQRLAQINRDLGTTMLIVEQNANLALRCARHAHVLETGVIVSSGTAAELEADENVRRAYLGY